MPTHGDVSNVIKKAETLSKGKEKMTTVFNIYEYVLLYE